MLSAFWIKTNTSKGAAGSDPSTADGAGTRTDGTTRAFTEAQLKAALKSAWDNGGKPDTIMVGSFNKQQFSTFTGRASPIEDSTSGRCAGLLQRPATDSIAER